jgi:hypothetical protein
MCVFSLMCSLSWRSLALLRENLGQTTTNKHQTKMKQSARLDHAINVGCREGSFYKTRTLKIVAKLPVKTLLANRVTAALITVCASQISISWQTVNIITGETKKTVDIFLRALESITALWWVGWAVVAFSKASLALTLTGRIAFESSAAVAARGALTTLLNAAFTRRTSVVGRAALAATCATLAAISIAAPISRAARARESSAATAHGANGIYSNADCRICANTTQAIESSAAVAARANFVFWKTAQIMSRTNGSSIAALAVTRAAHVNIGSVAALVITAREWATAAARGAIFTWFNADSRSCANTGNAIESIAAVAAHRVQSSRSGIQHTPTDEPGMIWQMASSEQHFCLFWLLVSPSQPSTPFS